MSERHWFPALGVRPGVFLRSSIAQTVQGGRVGTVPTGAGARGEGRHGAAGDSPASQPGPTRRGGTLGDFSMAYADPPRFSALVRHLRAGPARRSVGGRRGWRRLRGTRFHRGSGAGRRRARPRRRVVAEPAAPTLPFRFPGFFDRVSDSAAPPGGPSARRSPMSAAPGPGSSLRSRRLSGSSPSGRLWPGVCRETLRRLGFGAAAGSWDSPFADPRSRRPGGRAANGPGESGPEFRRPSVRPGSASGRRARSVPSPSAAHGPSPSRRRNRKSPDSFSIGRWPRSPVRRTSRRHAVRTGGNPSLRVGSVPGGRFGS